MGIFNELNTLNFPRCTAPGLLLVSPLFLDGILSVF
ncbi:hypothetical protein BN439_1616 [Erwinia amylovora Ea644]|nr:hypothetical protein BN439_1616 [Erwinia amylovora Ea644]CCP06709.1 hypothetical protein BN440_1677 [Erwinia amylovora MR1]